MWISVSQDSMKSMNNLSSTRMGHTIGTFLFLTVVIVAPFESWADGPIDSRATPSTRKLYQRLKWMMNRNLYIGHQNANLQGVGWKVPLTQQSDMESLTGKTPTVVGYDFGNFRNLDKLPYTYFLTRVKQAHERGAIITFSWHAYHPITKRKPGKTKSKQPLLHRMLPGKDLNSYLTKRLDKIADFAHRAKNKHGKPIPILFRPFHEHNGDWFWWSHSSPRVYQQVWQYMVRYLRDKKKVHNFLYSFSPSSQYYKRRSYHYGYGYPGHNYVDVLGVDCYEDSLRNCIPRVREIVLLARQYGKLAALTETGWEDEKVARHYPKYWVNEILQPLLGAPFAREIAYLHYWRNARTDHHYLPYPSRKKRPQHPTVSSFQEMIKHPLFNATSKPPTNFKLSKRLTPWRPGFHILVKPNQIVEVTFRANFSSSSVFNLSKALSNTKNNITINNFHSYHNMITKEKVFVFASNGKDITLVRRSQAGSLTTQQLSPPSWITDFEVEQVVTKKTAKQDLKQQNKPDQPQSLFGMHWLSMNVEIIVGNTKQGQLFLIFKGPTSKTWKWFNLSRGLSLPPFIGTPFAFARTMDNKLFVLVQDGMGNVYSFRNQRNLESWKVRTVRITTTKSKRSVSPVQFLLHSPKSQGLVLYQGRDSRFRVMKLLPPENNRWSTTLLSLPNLGKAKQTRWWLGAVNELEELCVVTATAKGGYTVSILDSKGKRVRQHPPRQGVNVQASLEPLGVYMSRDRTCFFLYKDAKNNLKLRTFQHKKSLGPRVLHTSVAGQVDYLLSKYVRYSHSTL